MLLAFVMSLQFGSVPLTFKEVMIGLSSFNEAEPDMTSRILFDLRLPRALLAVIAGAGLAMVGALLQTSTRNDLADPFLFGLSSGASVGAVLVITQVGDALGIWSLPLAAFSGGLFLQVRFLFCFRCRGKRVTTT